jgi:ArsR family transcriptional regulator
LQRKILNLHQHRYICIYQYVFLTLSIKNIEKISKALGDNNRLKILMHISKKGGCGHCSEIQDVIDLAQPSVSHHIKILVEAGIIEPVKEGRNYKYNMNEALLAEYREFLDYLSK